MGRSREHQMRAPSKIKINVVRHRSYRSCPLARSLACLLARGLSTPLVRLAVLARMLSEYSTVCRFPLSISLAFPISVAHVAAQAHIKMHIYTHTNLFSPPIFLILFFLSSQLLFFVLLLDSPTFSLISISSPLPTSLDQVSRTKLRREREREREREKRRKRVKLSPRSALSAHQHHYSTIITTTNAVSLYSDPAPTPSARDLRVEHPSVFNAAPSPFCPYLCLARTLSLFLSLPFPLRFLISLSKQDLELSHSIASLRPPVHLATPIRLFSSSSLFGARSPRVRARPCPAPSVSLNHAYNRLRVRQSVDDSLSRSLTCTARSSHRRRYTATVVDCTSNAREEATAAITEHRRQISTDKKKRK